MKQQAEFILATQEIERNDLTEIRDYFMPVFVEAGVVFDPLVLARERILELEVENSRLLQSSATTALNAERNLDAATRLCTEFDALKSQNEALVRKAQDNIDEIESSYLELTTSFARSISPDEIPRMRLVDFLYDVILACPTKLDVAWNVVKPMIEERNARWDKASFQVADFGKLNKAVSISSDAENIQRYLDAKFAEVFASKPDLAGLFSRNAQQGRGLSADRRRSRTAGGL